MAKETRVSREKRRHAESSIDLLNVIKHAMPIAELLDYKEGSIAPEESSTFQPDFYKVLLLGPIDVP
jgi:hypothetical protein